MRGGRRAGVAATRRAAGVRDRGQGLLAPGDQGPRLLCDHRVRRRRGQRRRRRPAQRQARLAAIRPPAGDGAAQRHRPHPTTLARKNANEVSNNTLFNCTFYGSEGHPLKHAAGSGMLFENNLIEWTDWSATTRPPYFDPDVYNFLWGTYGSGAMTFEILARACSRRPPWCGATPSPLGPIGGLQITSDNVLTELNHAPYELAIQEDGRSPSPSPSPLPSPSPSPRYDSRSGGRRARADERPLSR